MKQNSAFNKAQHESDETQEKFTDAQHAALSKMMEGSPTAMTPTTPSPVAAPAAISAIHPVAGLAGAVPQPSFPGLHAALSKYATHPAPTVAPAAMKIAPAPARKPFQRRI
jgi:hypothetical protein